MDSFGVTDRGAVRTVNQDMFEIVTDKAERTALLVVCDGMGGYKAGDVASRLACDTFVQAVEPLVGQGEETGAEYGDAMIEGLHLANQAVYRMAQQPAYEGMGTTLVAALVKNGRATVLNVGDSRAYCFDGKRLHRLTIDHSYVEEQVRRGQLSRAQARVHPKRNLITRAVGVEPFVEGDLFTVALAPRDILLLCSDGLHGMVEEDAMCGVLCTGEPLSVMGQRLLSLAMQGGGRDNITIALLTGGAQEEV